MTFTIAIPAFKACFLHECIESVLAQTNSDFELVIVNDHSPEDLRAIVSQFHDDRIRYYENEVGCGAEHVVDNWNRCLSYARGEYIICMGDDDRLLPNSLSDYVELMGRYPGKDVYYARTQIIDEHSEVLRTFEARPEEESVYEMIWKRWNGRSMFIGDYLYRVESLRQRGGFYNLPFAWGSDAISAYDAARSHGIANTQEPGFQYRVNRQTISSSSHNIEGKIQALNEERQWFERFFECTPEKKSDRLLLAKLKAMYPRHFRNMYAADLINGIKAAPVKEIIKWLRQRKAYYLSAFLILKCFLHVLLKPQPLN